MRDALTIEQAGFAVVQDLGRPGHALAGIPANGAADAYSARIANVLAGNAADAPLIEVTGSLLVLTARIPLLFAVTGAAEHVVVSDMKFQAWQPLVVEAGCRVKLEMPRAGLRSYVAINGELGAPRTLGSVSPDPLLGAGFRLAEGDSLKIATRFAGLDHPHYRLPLFRLGATRPAFGGAVAIDVTTGPEATQFDARIEESAEPFTVSPGSDHVGLRLTGDFPARRSTEEILSRGVPVGAVEVPPSGGLLVLLRGRLITAGYPVVAVATSTAIDALGQVRPGDHVVFRRRTVTEAVAELKAREEGLAALAARVHIAYRHVGIGQILNPDREGRAQHVTGPTTERINA